MTSEERIRELEARLDSALAMLGPDARRFIEKPNGDADNSPAAIWERCANYWWENAKRLQADVEFLRAEINKRYDEGAAKYGQLTTEFVAMRDERNRYADALTLIRDQDYRGNQCTCATIAANVLKEGK